MRILKATFWSLAASIVYTYAGYPAILGLLARLRPRRAQAPAVTSLPRVTLIIAAYNEEEVIADKLQNSLALDYPADLLEIIVAADGSNDHTAARVRRFEGKGVKLLFSPERRGKVAAINRAATAATGEILVFSDANNTYDRSVIRELVTPFGDPEIGGVVGSKRVAVGDGNLGESEGLYWRYEAYIQRMETRLGSCTAAVGEILAIRRSLFEAPPEGIICDDFYMVMRLLRRGHRVVYRPEARSVERVSLSRRDEMKRRANIVAGRFQAMSLSRHLLPFHSPQLIWQVLSHKFMRPLVPLAMIGMLLSNTALALRGGRSWTRILLAQLAFYLTAMIGDRVAPTGMLGHITYLPTFLLNSNAAALMGLYRFVLRRRDMHLWERVQRRGWNQ
jgi:cellulose synthase/poly-beta-1,6-N-acetylglucosamine synthase-like glycosyltransferase